jgi:hypothetical protein
MSAPYEQSETGYFLGEMPHFAHKKANFGTHSLWKHLDKSLVLLHPLYDSEVLDILETGAGQEIRHVPLWETIS